LSLCLYFYFVVDINSSIFYNHVSVQYYSVSVFVVECIHGLRYIIAFLRNFVGMLYIISCVIMFTYTLNVLLYYDACFDWS
jgi:hypothetical protein